MLHFGTPFFALAALWVPLGGSVSPKRGFGGGPKMGFKTEPKKDVQMEQFWTPILNPFRDLVANLPFLLKTHGAYTRALILGAGAFKIHKCWVPFPAPFLDPFWVPKMASKWEPKWDPTKHKNPIWRILCPTLGAQGPNKRGPKNGPENGPLTKRIFSENGTSAR